MRYRDVAGAVEWLTTTLGFEKHTILTGPGGEVLHAELKFGRGIIMIGPVRESDFDRLFRQPDEIGGHETQSCYLTCEDADKVYARAKDAGAEIVLEVQGDEAGRRGFTCRDPQGHIWSIGTYDPWQGAPVVESAEPEDTAEPLSETGLLARLPVGRAARVASAAGLGTAMVLFGLVTVLPSTSGLRALITGSDAAPRQEQEIELPPSMETGALPMGAEAAAAEKREIIQTLNAVRAALSEERSKRTAAEQAAERVKSEMARAAEASRVTADALRAEGVRKERERANAEDTLRKTKETLEAERNARETAEATAKAAEATLASERKARLAAEAELEEAVKTISEKSGSAPKSAALAPAAAGPVASETPDGPEKSAPVTAITPPVATGADDQAEKAKDKQASEPPARKRTKSVQRSQAKPSSKSSKAKSTYIPPPSFGTP